MAIRSIKVLVCDVCETPQPSDDVVEEGGALLDRWSFHYLSGGGAGMKSYICLDCTKRPLSELLFGILNKENHA